MKKLLLAVLALAGFSTATLAQIAPTAKKEETPKIQVAKRHADKKENAGRVVPIDKAAKTAAPANAAEKKPAAKPLAVSNSGANGPLKKDGTPDRRYNANKEAKVAGPLKKDGTPDLRYKANKKHS